MYYATIVLLMAVLPLVSIAVEHFVAPGADLLILAGRWFVFWATGVRLTIAGIRQAVQPGFTARTIFEIAEPSAEKIVTELGLANLCVGLVGLASIARPDWVLPVAIVSGIYYGLAGGLHLGRAGRNRTENWAMWSDLWIFAVLAVYAVMALSRGL